ncbi:MAG: hypothetical protein ACYC8T_25645 [Myxococcaceae bacterium]
MATVLTAWPKGQESDGNSAAKAAVNIESYRTGDTENMYSQALSTPDAGRGLVVTRLASALLLKCDAQRRNAPFLPPSIDTSALDGGEASAVLKISATIKALDDATVNQGADGGVNQLKIF